MSQVEEDGVVFLAHYGIRGMRWGVRRDPGPDGIVGPNAAKAKKRKKPSNTDRTHYRSSPKRLTDDELQQRIRRMETEKRYNDLNKRDISTGEKHVTDVLTFIGKQTAQGAGAAVAMYAVKKAIEKKWGKEKASEIFKKKGK